MEAHVTKSSSTKRPPGGARVGVAVPNWFDLPLLLPDADPVVGRLQRDFLETLGGANASARVGSGAERPEFVVPKVSRLSPQKDAQPRREEAERQKHAAMLLQRSSGRGHWRKEGSKMVLRPRQTTQGGAAVVLDRLQHQRSRLRDKIWHDLHRFGLWHMGDSGGQWGAANQDAAQHETSASVDATVDAIMSQLHERVGGGARGDVQGDESEPDDGAGAGAGGATASAVFLTAMPPSTVAMARQKSAHLESGSSPATTVPEPLVREDVPEEDVEFGDADGGEQEEDEDEDEDEDEEDDEDDADQNVSLATRFRRDIQAPGLKRRQRLKDLHVFVENQLQKRLLRSWETIEIALSGSGDLSVQQIVKFLQNSDVKLSAVDAAKVQGILHRHLESRQLAAKQQQTAAAVAEEPPAKLSYAAFRRIFQPRDTQEAARWKREFDRDKVRRRQEREIYARELAALEQKVQRRLAESAKHMVELLDGFRCDPLAVPWTSDAQRLELRDQFLRVIFSKPARRRLSQVGAAVASLTAAAAPPADAPPPATLAVPQVRSALLQKYSRNGHFERIEVSAAAYLFHDIACDAVKQSIRALWRRREADAWPERQLIFQFRLKKAVFLEWKRFTRHAEVLRVHVLRKFVAWACWMRRWRAYYAFYRACFWPFYVWKRHLQRMILARGKSAFLRRVVLTHVQLRHFRAWQSRFQRKRWCAKQVARVRKKKARHVLRLCWAAWIGRFKVHIQIHRLWKTHGGVLQRLHKGYMVKVTFVLWRYYAILQQDMAARRSKCLHRQFPPVGAVWPSHLQRQQQLVKPSPSPYRGGTARATGGGSSSFVAAPRQQQASPSRGVSWYPPQASTPSGLAGSRSASMATASSSAAGGGLHAGLGEDDVDAFVHDDDDDAAAGDGDVRALSKIMETDLAPRLKRKTRLYDLCLDLYLRFRERDRRALTGNIIAFRRAGRAFFRAMRPLVSRRKKNRMATDLGAFRLLYRRFRWWVAAAVYKQPLARPPKDGDDDGLRRAQENSGDRGNDGSEVATGLDRKAEAAALDWKRDTEWRQRSLEDLPLEAARLRADLAAIAEENARRLERMQDLEMQLRERKRQEEVFLRKEAGATLKVRALLMQQAQQVLRTRGHRMHDVLNRGFDALLAQKRRQQLKSAFRGLRVVMMLRYTAALCHRAQLRNWVRLCRKFAFWQRHAARFHALRTKFHVFRTLLRHAVWKWKHESAGLSHALQRRQQLLWKYDQYVGRHGLLDGSPAAARIALTKYSPANAFHGVFLRWAQHTQLARTYNDMVRVARRKHELWRMHSVFQTFKTYLKAKYTVAARRRAVPFLWRQCVADLDAMHCKIVALRARLPTQRLRRQLRLMQHHLQQTATGAPTLKQIFQLHEQEIRHRLFLESRLMFVAYNERRIHNYAERSSPLFGAPVGRAFTYEKAPPYGSISEVVVLCGKKVDAVSLVLKTNASTTVEGQLHGNPFGNREVFALARGEKLVSIEGFASQTIYGLRLGTSSGRLSKWFGHCEKGTKFELRSDWNKREEIVGLFGYADATSIHALGGVFRHTTLRNIFEGMWLQPPKLAAGGDQPAATVGDGALSPPPTSGTDGTHQASPNGRSQEDMALCDRQFAYFLQVRLCDVLLAMKRAHRFALRLHRLAHTLPWPLTKVRVMLGLMRWFFNAMTHGLVRSSDREEEGKRILQDGMNKRAAGEKAVEEGTRMLAEVDSYRDEEKQLNVATLGVRKITELKVMVEQGEAKIATGKRLIVDGQSEILHGRYILPHIPMTKRMMNAIRRMYKAVQTKDYIDQMDPELRAILLEGDAATLNTPASIYDPV